MSRFKNIGSLFLALTSVFILTACGHTQKEPDTSDKTERNSSKQEETDQNQVDATSSASHKD
ncbi:MULTISPECIES: hypothetical protein [Streptococcus]|uniref:Lipoprotein n=1 Tax=Streptococcus sanguinis SK1087 TaxID=888824 RepID=F3SG90_STRSA|nr:hypothetical protein [Streptococcus sanguinis]MBF1689739.1 hypothetical protein [Streptococcus cristatus]EGF07250.1 hypothetical protein HMPREF9394_0783 [Streptococcus sanguinis SK1057]EGG40777.1 hypothetical protein HMPREF9397_0162 [Streptococcus sanguinis SK1087]MBZ2040133.1 hypothetical protein [Streptococcus sanguinis]MBZ2056477.1 hypothetical protein [Streptococcus sanguinis]